MQQSHRARPTQGEIWRLFLPLSFSDIIMILSGPILTAGLARLPDVAVNLAAYSVVHGINVVIEAPVTMLLHAATTLSRSPSAWRLLHRFMLLLCLAMTGLHALVAFTPLYDVVFAVWLHQPAAVVEAGRHMVPVSLLWSASVGWRRTYQGFLIAHNRSALVLKASFGRLGAIVVVVLLGVLLRLHGALLAGLALQMSVLTEAVLITIFATRTAREVRTAPEPAGEKSLPGTFPALTLWYLPLAATAFLAWIARPFINSAIAQTPGAMLALAAWPVAWTTITLLGNAVRMVQQVALSLVRDEGSYRALRRFALTLTAGAVALAALLNFTPLAGLYLEHVIGVSGGLAATTLIGLQTLFFFPVLICWQNFYQALLIRRGQTGLVNGAAIAGSVILVAALYTGVTLGRWGGMQVAAVGAQVSLLAEVAVLWLAARPARAALRVAA